MSVLGWLRGPARPSASAPWWDAGGNRLSVLFWLAMAVQVGALFRQAFLPFVEYPQQVMLGAILHRMIHADAPERALYLADVATCNAMFPALVAYLAILLPIERAGEAALAILCGLTALGTLQLLRATDRPRARAFLVVPLLSTLPVLWGFAPFLLSVAIQLFALGRVLERPRVPLADRPRFDAVTAVLAALGAWANLLATVVMVALMLAAILADADAADAPLVRKVLRALRALVPLAPAALYVRASLLWQRGTLDSLPLDDDTADHYAYEKLGHFFEKLNWIRSDGRDHRILVAGLAALLVAGFLRRGGEKDRAPPGTRWLAPTALLVYLLLPFRFDGDPWGSSPRVAFVVVIAFLAFVPGARRSPRALAAVYCGVGIAAAATFFQTMGFGRADLEDFERLLDDAPARRRVAGLLFDRTSPGSWAPGLTHFPAYYVARKGGEVAVSFTSLPGLPVRYRKKRAPPETPDGFAESPGDYDPSTPFARYYDLLLVRTETPAGDDPRRAIFGDSAGAHRVRSHHGRWWLIEANAEK